MAIWDAAFFLPFEKAFPPVSKVMWISDISVHFVADDHVNDDRWSCQWLLLSTVFWMTIIDDRVNYCRKSCRLLPTVVLLIAADNRVGDCCRTIVSVIVTDDRVNDDWQSCRWLLAINNGEDNWQSCRL